MARAWARAGTVPLKEGWRNTCKLKFVILSYCEDELYIYMCVKVGCNKGIWS